MHVQPDYKTSIDFLKKWAPEGPWVLTSLGVDVRSISTSTFHDPDEAILWIAEQGKDKNLYFHVNTVSRDLSSKAERKDIKSMDWLHVDVDPRAGEDLELERARALKLLSAPPNNIPPPTVIVFSGGGYQGFWKLSTPFIINGESEQYEQAKRYNQQLELVFQADNCHNVDRIMRLPGTLNRPNDRKRKKGRQVELARVVEWHDDRVYDLSAFTPVAPVQAGTSGFATATTANTKISGNIQRVNDVNDLPDKVSNLCKVVIVQGSDPDDPTRFPSRSEALFFVCCELVRAGCEDELIYSVVTDPEFEISRSVLEKGTNSERYALRQIERARENAIDPWLRKMNEKHAVIRSYGGKPRVIEEVYDEVLNRFRLTKSSFDDFRNGYCNIKVSCGTDIKGNPILVPLGKWWLEHPNRRGYEKIVFAPGKTIGESVYNLWRGFGVEARPGDQHEPFLDHVRKNVCSGDQELYDYVIGWCANLVQNLSTPGQVALVFRGNQGVGKGVFAKTLGMLLGRHFLHVSNAQHLTGNFNAHLRDCALLFADEAFYAGDKRHASVLKTLITEDSLIVEPKGVDSEMVGSCIHLIMASNEEWVVPAGMDERRFCVLDVAATHMQDAKYFRKVVESMKAGGYENFLHMLLTYDISSFNVRNVPKTKALQDQKIHSFGPEEEWWFTKLWNGQLLSTGSDWPPTALCKEVVNDYTAYVSRFSMPRRGNETKLGLFLKRAVKGITKHRSNQPQVVTDHNGKTISYDTPYYYTIPPLATCRAHWDEKFGGPYDWPEIGDIEKSLPF